ncbi:hypothetical protein [Arthrobacter dokdonensis]|uniref:hypothetical protein n=1 Tax=Arthrobacter dokdonellae TaxID=2211210 RepID=UPI000DE5863E|nr:hypothetical protein [Arthrobacter dokdonellae]
MSPDQLVGLAVNVAIYLGLIAFILYRQMSAQPVKGLRLVVLPAALALFGLVQLARQPLATGVGGVVVLAVGLAIALAVGLWRGKTFRVWVEAGRLMAKGTAMTLVTWAVLIVVRLPFALLGLAADRPQGFVVGELLLALAATFAAQNAVIWGRANRLNTGQAVVRDPARGR